MNSHEIWQVEVQGHVYEANIAEIIEWIAEGSILPEDKIRKGSLRWIKAEKVPELYSYFNTRTASVNSSVTTTITDAELAGKIAGNNARDVELIKSFLSETNDESIPQDASLNDKNVERNQKQPDDKNLKISTGCCSRHAEVKAQYICGTCLSLFCKVCPDSFGGNVKICLDCGAMCRVFTGVVDFKSVGAINKSYSRSELKQQSLKDKIFGNFGITDFVKALIYPFKFKTSLIMGAIMFTLLMLGQTVSAFGISMYFPAVICLMLANMLVFGCLANTLDNFSQGKINLNFMPGFDEFELWDDVIHPFLLSFGVYIISFGLFIVMLFGALWQTSNAENQIEQDKQKIVSTVLPRAQNILNSENHSSQLNQVSELVKSVNKEPNGNLSREDEIARLQQNSAQEAANVQKLQESIRQNLQSQTQTENSTDINNEKGIFDHTIGTVLRLSLIFSVPIFIAFLWGIFYLPAACAVAGYTRSFTETVNPLVAFDTIKRLGSDYFKVVVIFMAFVALGFGLNSVLQLLLSSVSLPLLGNLPAEVIISLFTFYLSIVFSVILGMVLDKNSDKLNFRRN